MMKFKIAIILVFLFFSNNILSQDFRFGKVEKTDFETTALSGEDDPDAIVLFRKDHTRFNFYSSGMTQTNEVYQRILIKNEEGLKYATEKINLYDGSNRTRDDLRNVKAASYNLVNGKIVKTKLSRRDIYDEDINDYWRSKSFTIPGASIGSIIEFKYDITSSLAIIDDKNVQYDIPINHFDFKVQTPEYFTYNIVINPEAPYLVMVNQSTESNTYGDQRLISTDQILRMQSDAIPSLQEEPMSGSKERYRAKLMFELSGTRFPNSTYENFSTTWENVSKRILENKNFGDQLGRSRFFEEDLNESLKSNGLNLNTAYEILNFVHSKVKWNGKYGKYAERGIKKTYKEGSGNVADVNLLLISMLREKGFDAFPVLVSSINNGIPLFPTLDGFDYVITQLVINDIIYLVDATEPYSTFNVLPQRAAHWQGRVLKSADDSEWVDLTPNNLSKDIIMIEGEFDEDLSVNFKAQRRFTDQIALSVRKRLSNLDTEEVNTYLEGDESGLILNSHEFKNLNNVNEPLNIIYEGVYNNAVDVVGDKIYLAPLLFEKTDENPFKSENRKFPIDLNFPMYTKAIVNIKIPEGYEVLSIPSNTKAVYENDLGSYLYRVANRGNIITVSAKLNMNISKIQPQKYSSFRDFYIAIVDKDAERIVLQKKP
ncbi:MAG: DUF3857 domain-containing protein [Nonlabens sp.]